MSMNTGTPSGGTQVAPVREQAADVARSARQEATEVAASAADNAKEVVSEVSMQAKVVAEQAKAQVANLVDQTRFEVLQTAQQKGEQAAAGLRTFADQLRSLADGQPDQAGPLRGYVQEAQDRVSVFATRLENDGPQAVLSDVTRFARQRPGVFLMMAAGAGFAIGRLVRAGAAVSSEQHSTGNGHVPQFASNGGGYPVLEVGQPFGSGDVGVIATDPTRQAPPHDVGTPVWASESDGPGSVGEEF